MLGNKITIKFDAILYWFLIVFYFIFYDSFPFVIFKLLFF